MVKYSITESGLQRLKTDIKIKANRTYYLGASDSPKRVFVTKVDPNVIHYRSYPYETDLRIEKDIGQDLISTGMKTQINNLENWQKTKIGSKIEWIPKELKLLKKKLAGETTPTEKLSDLKPKKKNDILYKVLPDLDLFPFPPVPNFLSGAMKKKSKK